MLFSRQLPLADVVTLCRVLRHNLAAGLPVVQVFQQQSQRGPRLLRPLAGRLSLALQSGERFGDALDRERDVLPPLFIALARLGDETGHLPELFAELEKYYQLQVQLRRQFIAQSIMPVINFVFAVFLLAGLIFILGIIAATRGGQPMMTFLGLSGGVGSVVFLVMVFGSLAAAWVLYRFFARTLRNDRVLLMLPAVGPCVQALALGRFALALSLTLDSALPITRALRLSLSATGSTAYTDGADAIAGSLKAGMSLYEALSLSELFPHEFLLMVGTGEESGRVPELMRQQADYYNEEATRKLTVLTRLAALLVWLIYAGFMVWAIFRIAGIYLGALGI
jgi:type IV pilus assembly protein PilC